MKILTTDFYQISMILAYLFTDTANDETGFEAFVRHIKPEINPNKDIYVFSGEQEVIAFMEIVKKEIASDVFDKTFKEMILSKINPLVRDKYSKIIDEKLSKISRTFEYSVAKEESIVFPLVPVFQYRGPKIWGQPIETMVLNIINGKTGAKSFSLFSNKDEDLKEKVAMLAGIIPMTTEIEFEYNSNLIEMAKKYRISTTKPIFDASFRRAPSFKAAYNASIFAMQNGWNATSNTAPYFTKELPIEQIGGTMAHAFVMSFEKEIDAFKVWNEIYPNSTFLIDTYDVINAAETIVKENVKPAAIRIDSGDLKELSFQVRQIFDDAGWNDVKICISGDLTPEILEEFEKENVPFDLSMAGTKYVNVGDAKYTNAGFVYKLVQYERNGVIHMPQKKAEGKFNYPGLKKIFIEKGEMYITVASSFGIESTFDRNIKINRF